MTKSEISARAEASLMGMFVPVKGDAEVIKGLLNYFDVFFKNANQPGIDSDEVLRLAFRYVEDKTTVITHIAVNTLDDMVLITLPLKTAEEIAERGYKLDSKDGEFCFCYNATYPDCSELGYSYFNKDDLGYRRVG